jgi:pimeloyl-ACP methyl ester carboxylesterase
VADEIRALAHKTIREGALAALPGSVRLMPTARSSPAGTALCPAGGRKDTALVFVPGRWCSSSLWAVDEVERDLRVRMAIAGWPSVTVRYRSSAIEFPSMTADQVAGIRTHDLVADVLGCVRVAREIYPGLAVALCGFSMGASVAFLAATDQSVAALLALDGGIPAATDGPRAAPGCLENPYAHPRFVQTAVRELAGSGGCQYAKDVLRWRLCQDVLWPAAQVEEVRCGVMIDGTRISERLRQVICPVLTVSAGDRDPVSDRRARRTVGMTSAQQHCCLDLPTWNHEDVATRRSTGDDGFWETVSTFLSEAI